SRKTQADPDDRNIPRRLSLRPESGNRRRLLRVDFRTTKLFRKMIGQGPHRRTIEQFNNGNLPSDQLLKPQLNLDHQKRVSTELEKRFVETNRFDSKDVLPDFRDRRCQFPPRTNLSHRFSLSAPCSGTNDV